MTETPCVMVEPLPEVMLYAIVHHTFGENARILSYELLSGGLFNTSYHVLISNPDLDIVLRVAPSARDRMLSYEETMMGTEPVIYAMMRDAGVPVPRVLAYDTARRVIPRDFICMEYVSAERMDSPVIPVQAKSSLLRDLGKYLSLIHGIQGSEFGWPTENGGIRGHPNWSEVFAFMLNEVTVKCATHDVISKADVSRIEIAFGACRYLFDKVSEPRLTHNDIWEPNVLVRKNDKWHIVALLDADRAMFADREFESALWWNTESAFWDGYGTRLDPSPEAELRRKFYELYVNLWQAFAFRVQISHPDWCDSFRRKALKILEELSA